MKNLIPLPWHLHIVHFSTFHFVCASSCAEALVDRHSYLCHSIFDMTIFRNQNNNNNHRRHQSGIITSVVVFRKPNAIPLSVYWSISNPLVIMASCTPSIQGFFGRPMHFLSAGIHSIISLVNLCSGILFIWPYHYNVFFSIISIMSGFFCPL